MKVNVLGLLGGPYDLLAYKRHARKMDRHLVRVTWPISSRRRLKTGPERTLWLPVWLPADRPGHLTRPLAWWAQLGSNQ